MLITCHLLETLFWFTTDRRLHTGAMCDILTLVIPTCKQIIFFSLISFTHIRCYIAFKWIERLLGEFCVYAQRTQNVTIEWTQKNKHIHLHHWVCQLWVRNKLLDTLSKKRTTANMFFAYCSSMFVFCFHSILFGFCFECTYIVYSHAKKKFIRLLLEEKIH